jgi:hypothetical protein
MTDTTAFVNTYIERLIAEVFELTKLRIMNETRLIFTEQQNAQLVNQVTALTEELEALKHKSESIKKKGA